MADKIKKYLKNLDKETTQAGNAGETLRVLKGTPKGKAAANKLRNERGQMFGALLQGRRYDENGKQIKKSTKSTPKPKVGPLQQPKKKLNALPKPTPKAKTKKPTKSEQNFLDGQKLKKKILKKTGVYKNTAT
jgi:hypothetical protein